MTEQDVDMMLRPIFGFGDPDYPQIYERKQLEAYCNQKQNKGAESDINNILQKLYGKSPSAAKFIKFGYELVQSYNLTCDRIANGTLDEWLPYYKEVHDMNANMKPIRDGYTRAMVAAAKPDSKYTLNDIMCEMSELEFDNLIRPVIGYGDMDYPTYHKREQLEAYFNSFNRGLVCDWSNIPAPNGSHVKSPTLLTAKALANLDNKNKVIPGTMTEEKLDKVCASMVGFGDPEYPQVYKREHLENFCKQL
ncbi:unnamed protein product [Medioppia subpectinata]|uniref:Uncharacterized protein n=1 Tax=Medioppia subpectinata TaxID=1979941 RepID=A0A7R9KB01_9ACAR|nr:unnamed protein product [Medioppia subpectinata]CAG2100149.1 unnamed protein product [Medioppia subpectinata]